MRSGHTAGGRGPVGRDRRTGRASPRTPECRPDRREGRTASHTADSAGCAVTQSPSPLLSLPLLCENSHRQHVTRGLCYVPGKLPLENLAAQSQNRQRLHCCASPHAARSALPKQTTCFHSAAYPHGGATSTALRRQHGHRPSCSHLRSRSAPPLTRTVQSTPGPSRPHQGTQRL